METRRRPEGALRVDAATAAGLAAFAIAFAFYTATLLPGVAYWDTGEMQTVPYVLGIAHPTGFPLFVLGGWFFAHALPLGTPAWRLSLFSALASAGAAGCLAALVVDLSGSWCAGVCAAVVFALGEVAWTRGVRAEVHDLALFFVAFAVTVAGRAARPSQARFTGALAAAGLACGLGIATHPVAALALPGVVLIAWPAIRRATARGRVAAAALVLAPLALYAYLPLRSAFVEGHGLDPAAALGVPGGAFWDNEAPSTWPALLRYITGADFDPGRSVARLLDGGGLAHVLTLAASTAYREYSFLVLALALCGLAFLIVQRPLVAAGLVVLGAGSLAFAANFSAESDVERYLLAGLWAAAAAAGVGAWWLASALSGDRPVPRAILASALLLGGLWPNAPAAARDLASARVDADARSIGGDVGARIVPGSLVVASWSFAAPLAYDTYVARTLDAKVLCAWPADYIGRFGGWRRRFGHVYFVLSPRIDVSPFARRLFTTGRYALSELRS
jgi:hypothetical protein